MPWPRATGRASRASRARRAHCGAREERARLLGALDQLDLVAVRISDEGDHGRSALDGTCLARDGAAAAADLLAGGLHVGDADRQVAERGADLVARHAVVVRQLDLGLLRVGAVADEGERIFLLGSL